MGNESEKSEPLEYEYVEDLEVKVLDLEVQVSRFAGRVEQLMAQRAGLVRILRDIKANGGCTTRHWRYIDRILATGRWEDFDGEDSGRH